MSKKSDNTPEQDLMEVNIRGARAELAREIFMVLMGKFATAGMTPFGAEQMADAALSYADAFARVSRRRFDDPLEG